MRILIVSALQVFPPLSGGNRRTAMLAEGLTEHGFEVRVFSLIGRKRDMLLLRGPDETSIRSHLCEYVLRPRLLWLAAMAAYKQSLPPFWAAKALEKPSPRLTDDLTWADALVLDFPFVLPAAKNFGKPVILNTHNIESRLFGGTPQRDRMVVPRVEELEQSAVGLADVTCCSSQEEIEHFSAKCTQKRFFHIPNCIDAKRFSDSSNLRAAARSELNISSTTRVLYFPASAYGPNREGFDFLADFASSQQALLEHLNIIFLVAGSVSKTRRFGGPLRVLGPVPQVEPWFAAADLGVNPIFHGSGTSIKVGEMIAAGLPILTTQVGARGFVLDDRQDAIFFDRDNFADRLNSLPTDEETLLAISTSARLKNSHYFDVKAAITPLASWLNSKG